MKIGLVIESLDPRRGGVEQWTSQFAVSLLAAGHQVHVLSRGLAEDLAARGVIWQAVPDRSRLGFAAAAADLAGRLDLDVVHDTGCGWACDVLQPHGGSRAAANRQNLRLTPAWRRPWRRFGAPLLPRYREFSQLAARQYADRRTVIVAISKMVARDLIELEGVDPAQIRLVYNGVDLARFSPTARDRHRASVREQLGVAADELLVLIVAHNHRLKGVPGLAQAVRGLAADGHKVRLVVAGGDAPRQAAGGSRFSAGQAVLFLGSVSDPLKYYAAADLYAQPTYYDPCSLVVLEALACGLPVITTRFNGAAEFLADGGAGRVLADPGDVTALSQAIAAYADGEMRAAASRRARQSVLAHSLERNHAEILAIYQEVTGGRRAA